MKQPVEEVVNNASPPHFHVLVNEATDYYDDAVSSKQEKIPLQI